MDVLKKENRMSTWNEEQPQSRLATDRTSDPAAAVEKRETVGRATDLLNRLPGNQREVIRLKVQDGMSYREISEVTGLSVSNVGFLLHKGIKAIREQLSMDAAWS
jgi:RNA polymerase sigma-70 factor (ECF subfamily)